MNKKKINLPAEAAKMKRLRKENLALKETITILSDERLIRSIRRSLKQIEDGKFIHLSEL